MLAVLVLAVYWFVLPMLKLAVYWFVLPVLVLAMCWFVLAVLVFAVYWLSFVRLVCSFSRFVYFTYGFKPNVRRTKYFHNYYRLTERR